MSNPGAVLLAGQTAPYEGVWSQYSSVNPPPDTEEGTVCVVASGTHGLLNTGVTVYSVNAAQAGFGLNSNVAALVRQALQAGANQCVVIQPGTSGTAPTLSLVDTTSGTPVHTNTVTALWPTADSMQITLRPNPADATTNQMLVYVEGILRETWSFTSSAGQPAALTATVAGNSQYVTVATAAAGNGTLADVTQSTLTGGTAPTQNTGAYTTALGLVEGYNWLALCMDTTTTSVFATLAAEMDQLMLDGYRRFAVLGESSSTALATALAATNSGGGGGSGLNDPLVLYTVGGILSNAGFPLGTALQTIDGYQFAARVAGLVAIMNPGDALTAALLPDAAAVVVNNGVTTPSWTGPNITQIEAAGAITARQRGGQIVLSMGKTTFQVIASPPAWAQTLSVDWTKVQMCRALFGLLDAIDARWELQLTNPDRSARPPNDKYGWAELTGSAQVIVNQYVTGNRVQPGATVVVDTAKTAAAIAAGQTNTAVFDLTNLAMIDGLEIAVLRAQFGLNS